MATYGLLHIGKTGGTAAKTVLKAHNREGPGDPIELFGHKVDLTDVIRKDLCDKVMFFVRDPVARYVSAFNSRLRQGLPRHFSAWTPLEQATFAAFPSANAMAEALSSPEAATRERALDGMMAIRHLRYAYTHFLDGVEFLERVSDRIHFIGATESFDADFALLRRMFGVSEALETPSDERGAHRTPDGFDKTMSDLARRNVMDYYENDYLIYNWCLKRREDLIAVRTAELAERAAAAS
jgi:hypothetical protein